MRSSLARLMRRTLMYERTELPTKRLEQACQILRRDMELFREIIHIERVGKMTFDFLHCRADILEIQRMLRPGKAGAELGKACQELKASDGERSIVDVIFQKM